MLTDNNVGLLIYIPGFSEEGILLALAGGSNETFVSTNALGSQIELTKTPDANEQHRCVRHCYKQLVQTVHFWSNT
jgi:hypothetical protein